MDKTLINNDLQESLSLIESVIIRKADLSSLITSIERLKEEVRVLKDRTSPKLYTNKTIKDTLGVGDKLLKKYRDDGLLGFHQVADKYWYTQEDIDNFLKISKVPAYRLIA